LALVKTFIFFLCLERSESMLVRVCRTGRWMKYLEGFSPIMLKNTSGVFTCYV
jgi:hypothetical protein